MNRLQLTQKAVAKIIGAPNDKGLSNWLNGKGTNGSVVRSVGSKVMQWYSDNKLKKTPPQKKRRLRKKPKTAPSKEATQAHPRFSNISWCYRAVCTAPE